MRKPFRQALTVSLLSTVMAVSFSARASLTVVGDLGGETTAPSLTPSMPVRLTALVCLSHCRSRPPP